MGNVRDFSEEVYQELISNVEDNSKWYQKVADFFTDIRFVYNPWKNQDISSDMSGFSTYLSDVVDKNDYMGEDIRDIFTAVKNVDTNYGNQLGQNELLISNFIDSVKLLRGAVGSDGVKQGGFTVASYVEQFPEQFLLLRGARYREILNPNETDLDDISEEDYQAIAAYLLVNGNPEILYELVNTCYNVSGEPIENKTQGGGITTIIVPYSTDERVDKLAAELHRQTMDIIDYNSVGDASEAQQNQINAALTMDQILAEVSQHHFLSVTSRIGYDGSHQVLNYDAVTITKLEDGEYKVTVYPIDENRANNIYLQYEMVDNQKIEHKISNVATGFDATEMVKDKSFEYISNFYGGGDVDWAEYVASVGFDYAIGEVCPWLAYVIGPVKEVVSAEVDKSRLQYAQSLSDSDYAIYTFKLMLVMNENTSNHKYSMAIYKSEETDRMIAAFNEYLAADPEHLKYFNRYMNSDTNDNTEYTELDYDLLSEHLEDVSAYIEDYMSINNNGTSEIIEVIEEYKESVN